jgi:YfiH family protein
MLTHAAWADVEGLRHGFLDAADCGRAIAWEPVLAGVGVEVPVVTPHQVHGTTVGIADVAAERMEADGMVAVRPGIVAGVVTADCVPVLVLDRERRAAAALHAGWRGAAHGVLRTGVEQLRRHAGSDASKLEAVIGPAIGGCCYEVGQEVRAAFEAANPGVTTEAWTPHGERLLLDLPRAVALVLGQLGLRHVSQVGPCTRCGAGYYSYRRDGAGCGRQLSFIGWS